MAKTLDKSRDFGDVYGSESGARYVQDNLYFDVHGSVLNPEPEAKVVKTRTKAKATELSTDDQLTEQLELL